MNPLTKVKNLNKMNERELQMGVVGSGASWHDQYKDSAWVFVGGLPYELTEGDVLCVFSQYGEPVTINMVRDKQTGKSKGYAFLCYEDQRSTVLAVDNLNGSKVCGRTLRVDHVEEYRRPKEQGDEDDLTVQLRTQGLVPTRQNEPQNDANRDKNTARRDDREPFPQGRNSDQKKKDAEAGMEKSKKHNVSSTDKRDRQKRKKRASGSSTASNESETDKRKQEQEQEQERHRSSNQPQSSVARHSKETSDSRRTRRDIETEDNRKDERRRSRSPKRPDLKDKDSARSHKRSRSTERNDKHRRNDDTESRRRYERDNRSDRERDRDTDRNRDRDSTTSRRKQEHDRR